MYQNIRQAGGSTGGDNISPTGLMIGTGVRIVSTEKELQPGIYDSDQERVGLWLFKARHVPGTATRWNDGVYP